MRDRPWRPRWPRPTPDRRSRSISTTARSTSATRSCSPRASTPPTAARRCDRRHVLLGGTSHHHVGVRLPHRRQPHAGGERLPAGRIGHGGRHPHGDLRRDQRPGLPVSQPDQSVVYAVQATLSQQVSDGGVLLSAYTGVRPSFNKALGAHRSASGRDSTTVLAHAGAVQYPPGRWCTRSPCRMGCGPGPTGRTHATGRTVGRLHGGRGLPSTLREQRIGGSPVDVVLHAPSTWLASAVVLNPH